MRPSLNHWTNRHCQFVKHHPGLGAYPATTSLHLYGAARAIPRRDPTDATQGGEDRHEPSGTKLPELSGANICTNATIIVMEK